MQSKVDRDYFKRFRVKLEQGESGAHEKLGFDQMKCQGKKGRARPLWPEYVIVWMMSQEDVDLN